MRGGWTVCAMSAPRARVLVRVERLARRQSGRCQARGAKASRRCGSTTAPATRVYFKRQGDAVVVLLAGGDKRSQAMDIATALGLARNL